MKPSFRRVFGVLVVLGVWSQRAAPQQNPKSSGVVLSSPGVTLDDLVNQIHAKVVDLSADGRWAVVRSSSGRDGFGSEGSTYRFGDLTYRFDAPSDLWIVDTKTGDRKRVFPDRRTTNGGSWSPDGATL